MPAPYPTLPYLDMKPLLLLLGICLHLNLPLATSIKSNFRQSPADFDPYATLALHPTASPTQIQKAYRLKARETHPDKNPSPNANEQFRFISDAFDILSDPQKKRAYDDQRRREETIKQEHGRRQDRARQAELREREAAFRRKQQNIRKARAGYNQVLKWTQLSQMEKMAMDTKNNLYTANVLLMFVANKAAEKKGEEEYFFPHPFVRETGAARNNDVLLVAKVRYNNPTPLTRLFRAPSRTDTPYFIFAKKGDALHHYHIYHPKRYQVDLHDDWKQWVQSLLIFRGTVVNRHSLPVTLFILRDGRIEYLHEILYPGYEIELSFRRGDRILAFDYRLDKFPGGRGRNNIQILQHSQSIAILDTTIASEPKYVIHNKRCYDLSTQCYEWSLTLGGHISQCHDNPEFMHHICPYTCGICSDGILSDLNYLMFHYPEHKVPSMFQGLVRSFRVFMKDVKYIADVRKSVFLVLGLLLAFNIVFFETALKSSSSAFEHGESGSRMLMWDVLVVVLVVSLCCGLKLFVTTPRYLIPMWLKSFHEDFNRVAREPDMYVALLIAGIFVSFYVKTVATFMMKESINNVDIAFLAAVVMGSIAAGRGFRFYIVGKNTIRWLHLWDYRKNAAFVFVIVGALIGTVLMSLKRLLNPFKKAENLAVFLIPNLFVIGGVVCLSTMDHHVYSDFVHVTSTNKTAAFVLVLIGMVGGLLYMKLINNLTSEDVVSEAQKLKVD